MRKGRAQGRAQVELMPSRKNVSRRVLLPLSVSIPHSPSPEEGLGDEFDLIDHSDLHILDFSKYSWF